MLHSTPSSLPPARSGVFLSYARADGEEFATNLRLRLEAEHIVVWQDRIGMEGGQDWWRQITEALDRVEFLVLVMTSAALASPNVRKEWRYARQQGVCVYPVKAVPDLKFASLPRWMRDMHFYDLVHDWPRFLNDLNTRCEQRRVPFMVEDLPPYFVPRPNEFQELIGKLLDEQREEPVAITAALHGAGGYGKTTMARAVCHDERIQEAFDDGILWVTLGEHPGNLVEKIRDLISMLSREPVTFTGIDAAIARLAELLADRDILLVIDDVWDEAHLRPFLQGGKRSARLITTRNEGVLPQNAQSVPVDAMRSAEAVQLLSKGLEQVISSPNEKQALQALAARLGEWPLLLKLANGVLWERVNRGQSLPDALTFLNKALDRRGLTAFDAENPQSRNQAVSATLRVSFELLKPEEYARYQELAVFPEDVDIPLATVQKLWGATGGLDDFDTEELCHRLYGLSLLLDCNLATRTIRLHDVVRAYLQQQLGTGLVTLHGQLLDAYTLARWADLPRNELYLWDHLATHLIGARRTEELIATVKDLRYLAMKTLARNAYAVETDLERAEAQAPLDVSLRLLKRHYRQMSHLLSRCTTFTEAAPILFSRLAHLDELSSLCQAFEPEIPRPFLIPWHSLPDLPHPALIRTLQGHTYWVNGCAVSPQGDSIVSASFDGTLKVWDARTGATRLTLEEHGSLVNGCAVSPDGDYIVSASSDPTLKVWDARTGATRLTLEGHTDAVKGCAVSPDGAYIVSASSDTTLRVWDAHTGAARFTLEGHTSVVNGCAVSPDGDYIVSASSDTTLKVWDARTGATRLTLEGHTDAVNGCAVSPQGDYIVSASNDTMLKVWDARTGVTRLTLKGHRYSVYGCAVSPDGAYIVSASSDPTLKVWDARTGAVRLTLEGHTHWVRGCAVSPDGDSIVSASWDTTLKVWDAHTRAARLTLEGHTHWVRGCAVSPDGDSIVSASSDRTLKVWDARTGATRLTLEGHTDSVSGCAVSPDGDYIVSASDDTTLKLWDVRSAACLCTLFMDSRLNGCAFHPDGEHIVAAGDGGVYFLRWVR
jgi:WD40 repeat protein